MREDIMKLFGALSQARILYSDDYNLIYSLLVQIYNNLYSHMDKETKKKHEKFETDTRKEMLKLTGKKKRSYFMFISNAWERELRALFKQVLKDAEFTPGGV